MFQTIRTPTVEIAYETSGPVTGAPVVLLHGWPSDPRDHDGVAAALAASGCRVLVPWLRGFGNTKFLDPKTARSGQQASVGADLRDFWTRCRSIVRSCAATIGAHALRASSRLFGRARARIGFYDRVQSAKHFCARRSAPAEFEHRLRYQWYFNTERGRDGLERNRRDICRLLWRL